MTDGIVGGVVGFLVALVAVWILRNKLKGGDLKPDISHSLKELRAVGELVAFKLISQQIVTAEEHAAGKFGKNWLGWLLSSKKMALVIEYEMDFKYNLRDQAFKIVDEGEGRFRLVMPPCTWQTNIRNVKLYDETNSRWLPWLLGDVTEALGPGFDETEKNRLMEGARHEADEKANRMVVQLESEVQSSARETIISLARGFGADHVDIDFAASRLVQQPASSEAGESTETATAAKASDGS